MRFGASALSWIRSVFIRIPIYGQLLNSPKASYSAALREMGMTIIFSLLPLWLYPIIVYVGFGQPFWNTVRAFISNGEFFIYSAALVGPLIYAITKTYGEEPPDDPGVAMNERNTFPRIRSIQFPYGLWFVLTSIVVCCFAAMFFGIMRVETTVILPIKAEKETLLLVSCLLYILTLSCVFCVSVYRVNLESSAQAFGRDTQDLRRQWEKHHGRGS